MVLKLLRNLYVLKDAGRTWFEHLTEGLKEMEFKATTSDPCIYKKENDMIVLYVDDCIIISNSKDNIDLIFKLTKKKAKNNEQRYHGRIFGNIN